MAECELPSTCNFYNDKMRGMPATSEVMKNNYCRQKKEVCARYMVFEKLGRESVSPDLYPSEIDKANGLIS